VRVCALCPLDGPRSSDWRSSPIASPERPKPAEKVARVGLAGLAQGKSCVISGAKNRLMLEGERLCTAAIHCQDGREDDAAVRIVGMPQASISRPKNLSL